MFLPCLSAKTGNKGHPLEMSYEYSSQRIHILYLCLQSIMPLPHNCLLTLCLINVAFVLNCSIPFAFYRKEKEAYTLSFSL